MTLRWPNVNAELVQVRSLLQDCQQRRNLYKYSNAHRKEYTQTTLTPLTPNDHYSGRTAPLTSKRCILYIYSTNRGTEHFKRGIYSPFFLMQFVS